MDYGMCGINVSLCGGKCLDPRRMVFFFRMLLEDLGRMADHLIRDFPMDSCFIARRPSYRKRPFVRRLLQIRGRFFSGR